MIIGGVYTSRYPLCRLDLKSAREQGCSGGLPHALADALYGRTRSGPIRAELPKITLCTKNVAHVLGGGVLANTISVSASWALLSANRTGL